MKKRGLSYVDWSVSAAIFIIFIISSFVLLGPFFRQDNTPEYLTSILKEGIEENLFLELIKFPLFVEINTDAVGSVETGFVFNVYNLPPELSVPVLDEKRIYISSNVSEITKDRVINSPPYHLKLSTNLNKLGLDIGGLKIANLNVYISPILIWYNEGSAENNPPLPFNSTFGVSETINGLYEPFFNNFTYRTYDDAKTFLNYPLQKNFIIEVYNSTDFSSNPILNYTKEVPGGGDKVSTFIWSTFLIDNTTKKTPIIILTQVW